MNVILGLFFLFLFFNESIAQKLNSVVEDYENVDTNITDVRTDPSNQVLSSIYKTANKFFCSYSGIRNPELILYGTKSWVFPKQNTNLTLTYPPANQPKWEKTYFLVTGFNLLLFSDSNDSQGFIVSGGLLQNTISLTFMCNDVTMIMYEFWLFGVPSDAPVLRDAKYNPNATDMCFKKDES